MPYVEGPHTIPGQWRRQEYLRRLYPSRVAPPSSNTLTERSRAGTYVPLRRLSLAEAQGATPNLNPDWWARRYAAGLQVAVNPLTSPNKTAAVTAGNNIYLSRAAFADKGGLQGTLTHEGQHLRQQPYETALRVLFGTMAPQVRRAPLVGAKFGNEILPTLAGGGYPEFSQGIGLGAGNYQTLANTPPLLRPLFAGYMK